MKVLLDAHALLWWLADDPELSQGARNAIGDPTNDVLVSASTIWELAIKRELGKLEAPEGLPAAIREAGFVEVPITGVDAEAAATLTAHHRDPFDRLLIAQAARLDALVVTRDAAFRRYDARLLLA